MDLIERVARAICAKTNTAMEGVTEVVFDDPDGEFKAWVQGQGYVEPRKRWTLYTDRAKAAIEAIDQAISDYDDAETMSSWGWFKGASMGNNVGRDEMSDIETGTPDRITEVLARAWLVCDPNRSGTDPDALRSGDLMQPGAETAGKPNWHWFIPRAEALRDFLSDNGLVIRPKERP